MEKMGSVVSGLGGAFSSRWCLIMVSLWYGIHTFWKGVSLDGSLLVLKCLNCNILALSGERLMTTLILC